MVTDHDSSDQTPLRELRGWRKVRPDAGTSEVVRVEMRRADLEYWHRRLNAWAYEGGDATVHVGASSRDLRISADIEIAGVPRPVRLDSWSTFGDFYDHPVSGPRLRATADARGGFRGRIGDLLGDDAGRANVLGMPLATIVEFPGVPLEPEDIDEFIRCQDG
jgi:beta-glucosidase